MSPKRSLADMRIGEKSIIDGFTDADLSVKLLEMGCLPGSEIKLASKAPLGDPICIAVCGYNLSLRLDEASTIEIR